MSELSESGGFFQSGMRSKSGTGYQTVSHADSLVFSDFRDSLLVFFREVGFFRVIWVSGLPQLKIFLLTFITYIIHQLLAVMPKICACQVNN